MKKRIHNSTFLYLAAVISLLLPIQVHADYQIQYEVPPVNLLITNVEINNSDQNILFENDGTENTESDDGNVQNTIIDLNEIELTANSEFYYQQLSDEEKALYQIMFPLKWETGDFSVYIPEGLTSDDIVWSAGRALSALQTDYPEHHMYWERYFNWTVHQNYIDFQLLKPDACSKYLIEKSESRINDIIEAIDAEADVYTKVRVLNTILGNETKYSVFLEDQNSYSTGSRLFYMQDCAAGVFAYDSAVCAGYADAIRILCERMEIPCICVGNVGHAWNFIQMDDGQWYSYDQTVGVADENTLLAGSQDDFYRMGHNYHLSDLYIHTEGDFVFPVLAENAYVYNGNFNYDYIPLTRSFCEPDGKFIYKDHGDGTCTITSYEGLQNGDLEIPEKIDGLTVKEIGIGAFFNCKGFTGDLVIPDTVEVIDEGAFQGCSGLTGTVTLPSNLKSIGRFAFHLCTNITGSLILPESLSYLGEGAFNRCYSFNETIFLPDTIEFNVFDFYRTGFSAVIVNESNPKYSALSDVLYDKDKKVLLWCPAGKSGELNIPDGVIEIGDGACQFCDKLSGSLILPLTLERIGTRAFRQTAFTGDLILPDALREIGSGAFAHEAGSQGFGGKLKLSANLDKIESIAFIYCGFTGDIWIPEKIKTIESSAFFGNKFDKYLCSCTNNVFINHYNSEIPWSAEGMVITHMPKEKPAWEWDGDYHIAHALFDCTDCGQLIDCKVTSEYEMTEWPKEDIPGSGTYTALLQCSDKTVLKERKTIQISSGTVDLKPDHPYAAVITAEGGCAEFRFVPDSSGEYTFKSYGDSDTYVQMFNDDNELIAADYYSGEGKNFRLDCNVKENETYYFRTYYTDETEIGSFAVSLKSNNACGDHLIWNVDENNVLTISGYGEMWDMGMFCPWQSCRNTVEKIVLENGVTSIGDYAFSYFEIVEEINLPDTLESIGKEAFWYCNNIKRISLPESLKTIEEAAFGSCKLLETVTGGSYETIGTGVFVMCESLKAISLPDTLINIGSYVFEDCSSLMNICIPSGVNQINEKAFINCRSLEEISIPSTVQSVGYGVFAGCENLRDVYYEGTEASWKMIAIEENNTPLHNAAKHYAEFNIFPVSLSLNMRTAVIETGSSIKLSASITPENASNKDIVWSSSDEAIAFADENGVVTGLNEGTVIIRAASAANAEIYHECTVSVVKPAVTSLKVFPSTAILVPGETIQMNYVIEPLNADPTITWESSDNSIAEIDGSAMVRAVSPGSAMITATTDTGISAQSLITVVNKKISIYGSSLGLDGKIGINFYLNIAEEDLNDLTVVMQMGEKEDIRVPASEGKASTVSGQKLRMFVYPVAAKEMRDKVTLTVEDAEGNKIKLTKDETDYTEGYPFSAADYFAKAETAGQERTKKLARVLNNYGKYAQIYFNHNPEEVTDLTDVSQVTLETLAPYQAVQTENKVAGLTYVGGTTMLDDAVGYRLYFKIDTSHKISDYTFKMDGKVVTPVKSGSQYYIEKTDIAAKDLGVKNTVEVTDGENTFGIQYCALSYAYRALELTAEDKIPLQNMCRAMYLYNQQAIEYFNNK